MGTTTGSRHPLTITFVVVAVALTSSLVACSDSDDSDSSAGDEPDRVATEESSAYADQAEEIDQIIRDIRASEGVRATIVKVTKGDDVIVRRAYGDSMPEVPATPDMHFRNGAVVVTYLVNLLLQYVDEGQVTLDDPIDQWMPDVPNADRVTLRMLANQTSGYPDYETDAAWNEAFTTDPFHLWTFDERLDYAFSREPFFEPGTNWSYAHTNFMILGAILAEIGGQPLHELLQDRVLDPLGLTATTGTQNSTIPSPALHSYSSERVPPSYEEATYWSTTWGSPIGANETTTIDDVVTSAVAIGTGELISESSYEEMTESTLIGFGETQPNCAPVCREQTPAYNYGLGIVRSGDWMLQNPLLSGLGVVMAYLPSEGISIAVAVTLRPAAFGPDGSYSNPAVPMFQQIAAALAPDHAPPSSPS